MTLGVFLIPRGHLTPYHGAELELLDTPDMDDELGGGFKYFCILIPTWGNDPIWPIFFKGVETTN